VFDITSVHTHHVARTVKGKFHPSTDHESTAGEYRYSFTLSLTSALGVGGRSLPRPAGFPAGKTQYALLRRLRGP